MRTERPKISVPFQQIDIAMELVSITFLICIWMFPLYSYIDLPDSIPLHFNPQGKADDFGSKMSIWILPGIASFTFLLLFMLNKFPHLHNYMVNITEDNALKNYRVSTRLLRFINMFCMIMFAGIIYDIIEMSKGSKPQILSTWFLLAAIMIPIIVAIATIMYQNKINKHEK